MVDKCYCNALFLRLIVLWHTAELSLMHFDTMVNVIGKVINTQAQPTSIHMVESIIILIHPAKNLQINFVIFHSVTNDT